MGSRSLMETARAVASKARLSGHLVSLPSEMHWIEDGGFKFVVRSLQVLERKKTDGKKRGAGSFNPFLPYEEEMFVAKMPPGHVLLLNKFNVVDDHVLIVTEAFEEQTALLTNADFIVMWSALREIDGLSFYNAGQVAGASQRHKHLQVVPTPLDPTATDRTPFDGAIMGALSGASPGEVRYSPSFPFVHAIVSLSDCADVVDDVAAETTFARYIYLLAELAKQLSLEPSTGSECPFPYNLLATRDWLLIVPRSKESYGDISVNALGFAGALLIPKPDLLDQIRTVKTQQEKKKIISHKT